jgi:1,3-beta-glucan synthase
VVFLGTLNSSVIVCEFNANGQLLNGTDGCYFLTPVFDWITRCIISIFLVFMIAFLPLFLQGKPKPVLTSYLQT